MMLCLTVLLLFVSISSAQDSRRCSCMSTTLCEQAKQVNFDCPSLYEVCCEESESPVQPTSPPSASPATASPATARKLPICGVRGKNKTEGSEGETDASPEINYKIFDAEGGDISTYYGEFPWMVAVMKKDPSGELKFLCAASMIYPNVMLTTAHTVSDSAPGDLLVRAGMWNNTDLAETSKHQNRPVFTIVLHPGFVRKTAANDVALLILKENLDITDSVAPVCLPSSDTSIDTNNCIATGWGSDNLFNKTIQSVLKKVKLPLVDFDTCQTKMREYFRKTFQLQSSALCAGGNIVDTCLGDGGGPLMCATTADANRFVQIGITSWGVVGCARGYPGVYASVEVAADWIESQSRMYRTNIDPSTHRGLAP